MNLFGTDGIRGVANTELTCEIAFKLGRAMGTYLSPGSDLCVGKDTRISGDMLEAAIIAGATSTGRNVLRLGVITTPGLSFLVKDLGLGGGVMISASHNPAEYNGLKVFGSDGKKIPDQTECLFSEFILDRKDEGSLPTGPSIGRVLPGEALVIRYAAFLGKGPREKLNHLKIALDTANGATSSIAPKVWRDVGAKVTVINDRPDGSNINRRCGSTHLESLSDFMRSAQVAQAFDIGFAYDGDGDRCLVVDGEGNVLDGDHIMAILALDMADRGILSGNTVVGTVMSNYGLEECLRKHDIVLERTPVGDRYVLERMEERGFKLGGEQSGHIIIRDVLWAGDGILTSLMVADAMVRSGKMMSQLRRLMSSIPQTLVNVKVGSPKTLVEREAVSLAIQKAHAGLAGKGRVLVRPSGTEPVVRIMVEAEDSRMVKSCIDYLEEVIRREDAVSRRSE
jgi:phosphoglucosamine mutase